jgi:hypothetical protein
MTEVGMTGFLESVYLKQLRLKIGLEITIVGRAPLTKFCATGKTNTNEQRRLSKMRNIIIALSLISALYAGSQEKKDGQKIETDSIPMLHYAIERGLVPDIKKHFGDRFLIADGSAGKLHENDNQIKAIQILEKEKAALFSVYIYNNGDGFTVTLIAGFDDVSGLVDGSAMPPGYYDLKKTISYQTASGATKKVLFYKYLGKKQPKVEKKAE